MKKRNVFWGLLFLLLAASLLADGFNVFQNGPSLMKLGLTLLLFVASIGSLSPLNFFGVLMPLAFALILNAEYLGIYINNWPVIAGTFLLSLALTVLFKRRKKINFYTNFNNGDSHGKTTETIRGEEIKIESNFNSSSRYIQGDNIRNVVLEQNFGTLNVYFDKVSFNEEGARISVDCNFGTMNLFLPKNIRITNSITTSLASVNQDMFNSESTALHVYLDGDVSFGRVNIHFI